MFGLNGSQEMALSIVWMRQDRIPTDLTDLGITKHLLALRDNGMILMQTDMSHELAYVQALCPAGREHYYQVRQCRRRFKALSDGADELLNILCYDKKAKKSLANKLGRTVVYRELSRQGLIHVDWADDEPYHVEVTDDGWSYYKGLFQDGEASMNINVSPTINNYVSSEPSASSSSSSSSTLSSMMSSSCAIERLSKLDLDSEIKDDVAEAITELGKVSKEGDDQRFLDKLEKLSNVAKNAASAGSVVIPFISTAIRSYLGE